MNNSDNEILIRLPDSTKKRVPIKAGQELKIGRLPGDNDIALEGDRYVSRRPHARVTFDGEKYWVTDLGSKNGTYFNNYGLLPHVPEEWEPGDEVRIGDHYLYLVPAAASDRPPVRKERPDRPEPTHRAGRFDISVPEAVTVKLGKPETVSLIVFNNYETSEWDRFDITVAGELSAWVSLEPPSPIRLPYDTWREVGLTLEPPKEPHIRADTYSLTIRVQSQDEPDTFIEEELTVTVTPYHEFQPDLRTRRIVGKHGTAWVEIKNKGNTSQTYDIALEDSEGDLAFEPAQVELTVPAGEERDKEIGVMLRRRRWAGDEKSHDFAVEISTPDEEAKPPIPGKIVSRGYLSSRALGLLGIAFAIGFVLLLYVWPNLKPSIECHIDDSTNPPVAGQPFQVVCKMDRVDSLRRESFDEELDPGKGIYPIEALDSPTKLVFVASNRFGSTPAEVPVVPVTPTLAPTPTRLPTSTLVPTPTRTPTSTPEPTAAP